MFNLLSTIIVGALILLLPTHDYHTSLSTVLYNKATQLTEIQMQFETEHLEYVLNEHFNTDVHLGEPNEINKCDSLLSVYINNHFKLNINKKELSPLSLERKEVDYAITVLKFTPIKSKRKWKQLNLSNTLLYKYFPRQEHLVHFFYKDEKESMLFNNNEVQQVVRF